MGVSDFPEAKLARKIIKKYNLTLPIDVEMVIKEYATLLFEHIPIDGVDGVCVNMKVPGKKPTVIVNTTAPKTRRLFTLAHELGHLIIPWHIGTIIDEIKDDSVGNNSDIKYWTLEREANRFAAELLMPKEWLFSTFQSNRSLQHLVNQVCITCGVSEQAADIRVKQLVPDLEQLIVPDSLIEILFRRNKNLAFVQDYIISECRVSSLLAAQRMALVLPPKIVFCAERNGSVIESRSTKGTNASIQWTGENFIENPYQYVENYFVLKAKDLNFHWWILMGEIIIDDISDSRTWRQVLDNIVEEIAPPEGRLKFIASINGKLSGAYGSMKSRNIIKDLDWLTTEFIHRLDNKGYEAFVKHKDFKAFLKKRAKDFLNK